MRISRHTHHISRQAESDYYQAEFAQNWLRDRSPLNGIIIKSTYFTPRLCITRRLPEEMKFQPTIARQGLLLITIPLVFEIIFVLSLTALLKQGT